MSEIAILPEHLERGFIVVKPEYRRGQIPAGFPTVLRLNLPSADDAKRVVAGIAANPQEGMGIRLFLNACIDYSLAALPWEDALDLLWLGELSKGCETFCGWGIGLSRVPRAGSFISQGEVAAGKLSRRLRLLNGEEIQFDLRVPSEEVRTSLRQVMQNSETCEGFAAVFCSLHLGNALNLPAERMIDAIDPAEATYLLLLLRRVVGVPTISHDSQFEEMWRDQAELDELFYQTRKLNAYA